MIWLTGKMIRAAIVGGAGYTAGELLRILIYHPSVEIAWIHSTSSAGKPVWEVHTDLFGDTDFCFTDLIDFKGVDVLFLCMGHGDSRPFVEGHNIPSGVTIIDLSQDFRHQETCDGFVYGLPEAHRTKIVGARKIANPGCFATAMQLSLLPLASAGILKGDVHITATTGSTGAGQKPSPTNQFSWRASNLSVYKPFQHQHLKEVSETLHEFQPGYGGKLLFIPERGAFPRGIMAVSVVEFGGSQDDAYALYREFYKDAAFTFVSEMPVHLKQVVGTNKCLMSLDVSEGNLLVTTVIDNLTKGASGQAVQNMNLAFSLEERAGLCLKPIAF